MSRINSDTVRVIQLGVLSALVDGQASPEELDALAAGVAEHCAIPAAEAQALAGKMLERYVSKQLGSDPVAIVRHGQSAMRRLSGRQRRAAIRIATQVAAASPGGEASEATFLREIERMART
jgi:tellurite resistance protein